MKPTVYIKDLKDHIGEEVALKGWLYKKDPAVKLSF